MTRLLSVMLITAAGLLLVTASVQAQNGILQDRLLSELERTDQVISRSREVVLTANSSQAKLAYDQAVNLQAQAQERFRLGPGSGNWEISAKLTLQARLRAQEAIAAARDSEQNETALLRRLERASDLLDQAHEALGHTDNQMLQALYESAQRNLDRAWEFHRKQQYRAAMKLANQVERAAEKILQAINRETQREQNYERQVENVRRFMEQVRQQTADCDNPQTTPLLEQAQRAFSLAEHVEAGGQRDAALRALQNCRDLADQASRGCSGEGDLQRRYDRLVGQADHLAEELDPGDRGSANLLRQAREQLDLARRYLEQNQFQVAVPALKAAQLSLDELQRRIQNTFR